MIKGILIMTALLVTVPGFGVAQSPAFGFKAGFSVTSFDGRRIVTADYDTRLSLGAFAAIPLAGSVALQPEVIFTQKGASSAAYDYSDIPAGGDGPPIGVYLSEETRHGYIEIPLLLKVGVAGGIVRPVLLAGPSVAFLLGVRNIHGIDYAAELNSREFGVVIGGGVELSRLSLEARYSRGLTSAARDYDASFGTVPGDVRNRGFTVMAGLRVF